MRINMKVPLRQSGKTIGRFVKKPLDHAACLAAHPAAARVQP